MANLGSSQGDMMDKPCEPGWYWMMHKLDDYEVMLVSGLSDDRKHEFIENGKTAWCAYYRKTGVEMRRYRKRGNCLVAAVQLDLITDGFCYEKWGGCQRCKRGDWLVNNNGEIYTVDQRSFSETYEMRGLGCYEKVGSVLATMAMSDGEVSTKEGVSRYKAGDYIVVNGYRDSYYVDKLKFEKMYELCETGSSDADIE